MVDPMILLAAAVDVARVVEGLVRVVAHVTAVPGLVHDHVAAAVVAAGTIAEVVEMILTVAARGRADPEAVVKAAIIVVHVARVLVTMVEIVRLQRKKDNQTMLTVGITTKKRRSTAVMIVEVAIGMMMMMITIVVQNPVLVPDRAPRTDYLFFTARKIGNVLFEMEILTLVLATDSE